MKGLGSSNTHAAYRFEEWHDEGRRRFGLPSLWWYCCPRCGLAFTPEHQGKPPRHAEHGSLCPEAIGGCGFPWYGTTSIAEYRTRFTAMTFDQAGMVGVSKDGDRPAFWVFPFCPPELIPDDGRPAVVMSEPSNRYPDVRKPAAPVPEPDQLDALLRRIKQRSHP